MKSNPISTAGIFLLVLLFSFTKVQSQSFGTFASAVWISDCNQSNFFNTSGTGANLIGPAANVFNNANLGVHTQNSGTLFFRGGEVKTFKNPASSNVCSVRMFYRVYLQSGAPGSFNTITLPFLDDCNVGTGQFPSGGPCAAGDQKWQRVINDGTTTPYAPVNLTTLAPGNYILEVYYDVAGSFTTTSQCNDVVLENNGGNNYKASFSIQAPTIVSTNPSTCNGTEGSITINGLVPGATYTISYTDDGVPVGPLSVTANASGQIIISGLNAGLYSNFSLLINGCTTNLFTGIILSNPLFIPTFNPIQPFCAGTTAPVLPTTSNNGVTGTWSPAIVNNLATGTYTFTPNNGQCGLPVTITITVTPRTTPTFTFGTTLNICAGGTVPVLPNTSTNGITGTWSPSVVSNTASGVYTFTPTTGLCANATTFTVTVAPNITPTFSFGTSLTICAGGSVPVLPNTSTNGITGTWNPSVVSNTISGVYTFTPTAGLCATTTTFTVTVNPNVVPTFSFGTTLNICSGGTVPTLPNTSDNGITGTWNPSVVSNTTSGVYVFTPTAGLCAAAFTFTVTVAPNITPTFSFGTTLNICSGGTVPVLPNTSTNGITGTWNPSVVSNTTSGVYTFTPTAGLCATTTTFTVTIAPNITPTFSFGTTLNICSGGTVPVLPNTSTNGIAGTWNPSVVNNTTSGVYTFTPTAGLCATTTTFTVTVNPNVTPTFSFGTTLNICSGGTVPVLPNTSTNGITGTWNPSVVSNTTSGVYVFTPTAGLCATTFTFTVTVAPNITPTFAFGNTLSICSGGTVPVLPNTSTNGITGTWNPSVVSNTTSGVYVFTPTAGLCATTFTFTVTVAPNVTPTFSFGNTLSICSGGTVPVLPNTSTNGITGTWNPSVVSNTTSGVYVFTPTAGLCATTFTFTVTVAPNITPTFAFGSTLSICAGGTVPVLPTTSTNGITGIWNPSVVSNTTSGVYVFTPTAGLCATTFTFTVTVAPNITPSFSFGTTLNICSGGTVPVLPNTSTNGITGTWSPSVVSNTASGVYIFTPTSGLCATTTTLTVTINPNVTPTFNFGTTLTICSGGAVPTLPTTSTNGITGTWSPSVVSNTASGVYTFTPTAGLCAIATTLTVTVTPNINTAFSFGTTLTICSGGAVPTLPTTSTNGVTGTWNPSVVSSTTSGVYIFTPNGAVCATPVTYTVTVNPIITPTFSFGTAQSICINSTVPVLPTTSTNGITGTWNPSVVSNTVNGVYTFTPTTGLCATGTTFTIDVNAIPTVAVTTDTIVYDGNVVPTRNLIVSAGTGNVSWTNSNPAIGLPASGTGHSIPSFIANNKTNDPITGIITVTPTTNGCTGVTQRYVITVRPLSKDIFVPNVFSPNGDGKNDLLRVYGNYIKKVEMHIFNQWGQLITTINSTTHGWDGTHKGKAQPVGVYVYVLKAELNNGKTVNMKGSVTLIR
jgi:large repetitive protein